MPLHTVQVKPGFNSQLTPVANQSGWTAGNLMRWRYGLLEKIAGWSRLISTPAAGFIRALHAWLDLSNNKNLLLGTDGGPQIIVNNTIYDLLLLSGSITSDIITFSVGSGTTLVTAASTATVAAGQTFVFAQHGSIGGILIPVGTSFTVVSSTPGVSFTFNLGSNATQTDTGVAGIAMFSFTWADDTATVTFPKHGLSPGGNFTIDQTTLAIYKRGSGDNSTQVMMTIPGGTVLPVIAVPTTDTFTFDWTPFGVSGKHTVTILEGSNDQTNAAGTVLTLSAGITTPRGVQWFVDNLGENGLLIYVGSPLFVFQPPIQNGATLTAVGSSPVTAPQVNTGMFTAMPQAQVIVWGTEAVMGSGVADPLLLRFSDAGSYSVWTATSANQAGSYRLSRGSRIVGGLQAPQTTLIITDTDAWSMSYIGPPLVYGFTIMGIGCGLAAPHAIGTVGRNTYWMGTDNFWKFGDTGVEVLPCMLWDYFFDDLDTSNINNCFAAPSAGTSEIYFFFPSLTDAPSNVVNLLQYSQDFSNAVWVESAIASVAGGFTDPVGTFTAQRLVEDTSLAVHSESQSQIKNGSILTYSLTIYAHKDSTRLGVLTIGNNNGQCNLFFDPASGAVTPSSSGITWAIVASGSTTDSLATGIAGNGWLRYYVIITTDAATSFSVSVANVSSGTTSFYTGNGASGLIVWGAQLNTGTPLSYQGTTAVVGNECTRYVKYNVLENLWDPGIMPNSTNRTSWTDATIFGGPLAGDGNFLVQQHEVGFDDDGAAMQGVYAETGYANIADGEQIMFVNFFIPDMKWAGSGGSVNLTMVSTQYPGDAGVSTGPFNFTSTTEWIPFRVRARHVAMRLDWAATAGFSARLGALRLKATPAGRRP